VLDADPQELDRHRLALRTARRQRMDLIARSMAARRRRFGSVRKLPSGRYQATYLDPAGCGGRRGSLRDAA
jgi:hypothetical protein